MVLGDKTRRGGFKKANFVPEPEIQDDQETISDQHPMRDPKIEGLRRQINVLIEATNRFQLQLEGEDGTEHGDNHEENPFGRPLRRHIHV